MEALGCEASLEANSSFSGVVELPLSKRVLGKATEFNSSELPSITLGIGVQGEKNVSQDKGKALIDQEQSKPDLKSITKTKKDEPEPSFNIYLQPKEGEKGDSSLKSPLTPRHPIVCKFCGQQFSTTQALGGHQNAHKQEREIQRAIKAAHEFGTNPFLYHLQGTRAPLFHHGSYYGHPFQYHPYNGYSHRGLLQPRPGYPNPSTGLGWGSPGLGRAMEGIVGPYVRASGPIRRPRSSSNFDSTAASNLTAFLQAMENKALPAKKQGVELVGLDLSLKCSESTKVDLPCKNNASTDLDLPVKQNESTEVDLTLKL